MSAETHLAFSLLRWDLRSRILIPKYYDPDLLVAQRAAAESFELRSLGSILLPGSAGSRLGSWIRREHYGSGEIPYVRTSDLVNWRVRPDYKKGVSEEVYKSYKTIQDLKFEDILFVAHGTYLVGTVAIVTDPKMVLQDHVFRLRVNPETGVCPYLLLAALSTNFVRRQVRARQFSADIIDKIGERHLELMVPLPKDPLIREMISQEVKTVIAQQDAAREEISAIAAVQSRMTKERAASNLGFAVGRSEVVSRILIPKYYDPRVIEILNDAQQAFQETWVPLSSFVENRQLRADTGVEVGKMAYGTGPVPFIRTTDIIDLELRRDTRHSVSQSIFDASPAKARVAPGDVLVVRDGTYLVGSSALVSSEDGSALICGGIYRLRVLDSTALSPESLLLALNLPAVRLQLRARQFTRDVIDTLGKRLLEVMIPPLDSPRWRELGVRVASAMNSKTKARSGIGACIAKLDPVPPKVIAGRPGWSMR